MSSSRLDRIRSEASAASEEDLVALMASKISLVEEDKVHRPSVTFLKNLRSSLAEDSKARGKEVSRRLKREKTLYWP